MSLSSARSLTAHRSHPHVRYAPDAAAPRYHGIGWRWRARKWPLRSRLLGKQRWPRWRGTPRARLSVEHLAETERFWDFMRRRRAKLRPARIEAS